MRVCVRLCKFKLLFMYPSDIWWFDGLDHPIFLEPTFVFSYTLSRNVVPATQSVKDGMYLTIKSSSPALKT